MRYRLALTTPPASEPVTRQEAKDHIHETDTAQDAVIDSMIQAAREQAEVFTSRAFLPQTFTMYLDGFPNYGGYGHSYWSYGPGIPAPAIGALIGTLLSTAGEIQIPRAPLITLDSISYIDTTGTQQFLDPTLYQVDPQDDDRPVRILPAYGKVWPATRYVPNAVAVQFHAGYADASHVPATIKLAIKQILADWYSNRDAVVVAATSRAGVVELPNAAKALLWGFRLF